MFKFEQTEDDGVYLYITDGIIIITYMISSYGNPTNNKPGFRVLEYQDHYCWYEESKVPISTKEWLEHKQQAMMKVNEDIKKLTRIQGLLI